ncbi:ATP-binding protein [Psychrobacter sp. 1044]|uniref:ATP-binding protein n=1 Tax=Psychrobacter sp. 1044 TaxID=2772562 RepID=UPI001918DAC0|nr:ATP-binding protein [Psychrobacter sp. 1044]
MARFTKAERKKAKLRLALAGVSGCGKTYSALRIAKGMGGKIAVIDTENDSSSLYSSEFDFSSINLSDHSPESYIRAMNDAAREGFDIVIIDSLSHVWTFCKAEVDKVAEKTFKGNSWAAWSKVTPRYDALIQCLIQSDVHVITTMRAKTETAQIEVNGRKKVVKLGMKTEMRDGIEFEFTTVIDIDHETNGASVSKDRTHVFRGREHLVLDEGIGEALMTWLMDGVEEALLNPEQINTIGNMILKITHKGALAKVKAAYPDISKIPAKNYDLVSDKLIGLIDWQATQQPPSQPVHQNQQQTA